MLPTSKSLINLKCCQDPLLSYHDDAMYSVTNSTLYDSNQSKQDKLFEGWCGNSRGYLEADFKIAVNITGVATRGYENYWVKKYYMTYSEDGVHQHDYKDPADKSHYTHTIIWGNTDAETYSVYWLYKTLRVRTLRLYPYRENINMDKVCWRFEIFGCDGGLRNAVGLNQARFGTSFLTPDLLRSHSSLFNVSYVYKDIDENVGWCPLKVPDDYATLFVDLGGLYLLVGIAILSCPAHPCLPPIFQIDTFGKKGYQGIMPTSNIWFYLFLESGKRNIHLFRPISANVVLLVMRDVDKGCPEENYDFCMQLELYGKDLECWSPLGVESSYLHPHGTVKNEQMTASSAHADHPAHHGRRQHFSAWCADSVMLKDPVSAKSQYLQIDFLMLKNITAIATEGYSGGSVEDFYVYYATDEGAFHSLRERETNEKVLFSGYTGYEQKVHHTWFTESPFLARYVRINPQNWNNNMCLRVEFFGCDAVTIPLGLEFGVLSNDQITASSEEATSRKNWGRLNNAGWCASRQLLSSNPLWKELYHYLQIDLLQPRLICSVATQGKETKNPEERSEAVTSFYLKYSFKGDEWFRYHRLLVGEYYGNSVMRYWLDPSLAAKFIQFNPQSSWSPMHVCMRVEIYSCVLQGDLSNYLPLGMESFGISDAQLSASSEADASHSAVCSRLNHHIQDGAWIPAQSDRSEYLQIDLGWIIILAGIATQGHPETTYRTLAFKIRYGISLDEGTFKDYPKEFDGNVQEGSTVYDSIKPTRCRYVRICPLSWSEKVGLRAELYGYETDHCLSRLGLKSPSGPAFFNASSSAKFSLPGYGYLHSGLGTGAWCAEKQDVNQFLQVDLKGETIITGVATQGQKYFDSWVLSFTVAYSPDERAWHDYTGVGFVSQVLSGNKDRDTAVLHFFEVPLMARYLRFLPQKWKNRICMRVEIYGCALKVAVCAKCSSDAKCIKDNYDTETCFCKHGYFGDGIQCTDRDECSSSINPCPENADCSNTVGSYLCNCKQGFVNDGYNCIDIDECLDPNRCPHSVSCINTPGSFTCDCGAGIAYDIQSQSCNDIDECSTGSFKCNSLASCVNTHGSYTCFCAEGYTGHGRVSCVDVNECHRDPRICPGDTLCENTRGSYICVCQTGYVWKDSKCQDVDECSDKKSQCPLDADCANTIGSYMCNCKPGFIINGPYCIDYNECLSNRHNCDVNAWCTNTAGSYKCFCKEGYHGNGFTCEKDG